jgi:hypothetical protein
MNKLNLIYVSSEYSGAVVEGQVYKLLDFYYSKGWFNEIILLQHYSNNNNRKITENVLANHKFKYILFKANIFNPFKDRKTKNEIKKLLQQNLIFDNYIIHTRTIIMAYHVHKALVSINKPLNILADERGAIFYELKYKSRNSNKIMYKFKNFIQYFYFKNCYKYARLNKIQISTVTDKLKQLLVENNFIESNICVHHNIVSDIFKYNDDFRSIFREKLGICKNECLIILSSGEGGIWQNDNKIIDVLLKQNVKILNLGKNKVEKPGVINLFVSHNEMPNYLAASDIAILWRENEILNQVACPSKFGEFTVMGLFIIHNKTVDIATKYIIQNFAGLIVDRVDDVNINNDSSYYQLERQRRIDLGKKVFSVEEIAKSYLEKYNAICNN